MLQQMQCWCIYPALVNTCNGGRAIFFRWGQWRSCRFITYNVNDYIFVDLSL